MVGLIDGAIQGVRGASGECTHDMLMSGLAAITPAYPAARDAAEDVARFHFAGFDCLCLRCGALFDAAVADQERLSHG